MAWEQKTVNMAEQHSAVFILDAKVASRKALQGALRDFGFEVHMAASVGETSQLVKQIHYGAVLLNTGVPGFKELATCRELRRLQPRIGMVVLAVFGDPETKIQLLDAGADDCVAKSCHMGELASRLRALIRRSAPVEDKTAIVIKVGEVELDPARRSVHRAGRLIVLTPKEFELLYYLMSNAGFPITHARLLVAVWGPECQENVEYLRTYMAQLRSKLGDSVSKPYYLLTDRHVGYRFRGSSEVGDNRN